MAESMKERLDRIIRANLTYPTISADNWLIPAEDTGVTQMIEGIRKTVLQALLDPTPEMVEAMFHADNAMKSSNRYEAMFQAAIRAAMEE